MLNALLNKKIKVFLFWIDYKNNCAAHTIVQKHSQHNVKTYTEESKWREQQVLN